MFKVCYGLFSIWCCIDIAINIIFRFPIDPEKSPPSFFQGYFEYGRSVEGKFDSMISEQAFNLTLLLDMAGSK